MIGNPEFFSDDFQDGGEISQKCSPSQLSSRFESSPSLFFLQPTVQGARPLILLLGLLRAPLPGSFISEAVQL